MPSQGDLSGSLAWGLQQEDTAEKNHLYSNKAVALLPKKENYLISQDKSELEIGMRRKTEKK